jgi:hypothetical protein
MKTIIIVKKDGSKWPIMSWTKKRLNITHMYSMKAHAFEDAEAQQLYDSMKASLQAQNEKSETADVELMDMQDYRTEALKHYPVLKVVEGSTTAVKFGIEPFHHCHAFGDIINVVVWDTREVQRIIKVEDLTDEDIANFRLFDKDNYKHLKYQNEGDFILAKQNVLKYSALYTSGKIDSIPML